MLMSFGQLVCGCGVTVVALGNFPRTAANLMRSIVLGSFAFTAATDVVIAGCLCYYLHIIKTGNAVSNGLINRIIVITVHSGALSSSIACVGLFTLFASPKIFVSSAVCFVLGRAYFNALLSSLNARIGLRHQLSEHAAIGTRTIKNQLEAIGVQSEHKDSEDTSRQSPVKEK
jgi:hypothetical protein